MTMTDEIGLMIMAFIIAPIVAAVTFPLWSSLYWRRRK